MDKIKSAVDDLIEETRMRELDNDQVEWRVRKFTQVCEREIESGIKNMRKRSMLLERLQIMKCLYDHSSVTNPVRSSSGQHEDASQRNKRLQNIVRRRRMALEMIERVDPSVATRISLGLEKEFAAEAPGGVPPSGVSNVGSFELESFELSAHHWYFFYFNLFLLTFLICTMLLVVD